MYIFILVSLFAKKVNSRVFEWKLIIPTFVVMIVFTVICRVGFGSPLPIQPTWTYKINWDLTSQYYGFFGFFPEVFYLIIYAMERLVDLIFWVFLRLGMEPDEEEDIQKIEIKAKFLANEDYEKIERK